MKLLASDYDGTLCQDGVSSADLDAIQSFREKGNKFGIVTGRTIAMIKNELAYYNVRFDFLIGTNGGIVADSTYKILHVQHMDFEKAQAFMEDVKMLDGVRVGVSNGDIYSVVCESRTNLQKNKLPKPLIGTATTSLSDVLAGKKVNSFFIRGEDDAHTKTIMLNLETRYGDDFCFHFNNGTIDVSPYGVSKTTGVDFVKDYYKCRLEDVSVIGDGYNDISMIEHFNGFSVTSAPEDVRKYGAKVFDNIAQCIEHITVV